ncbi:MAG TPA: NAD(P)-dependent oxidoreductase [Gemmatimonadaceae bacterium]|nr:NAD(P)-dependent oxidoreductase [Gemmatimonadaceae bacterium]
MTLPSHSESPVTQELRSLSGLRILVTGADGMLGRAFREAVAPLGETVTMHALAHAALDVTDRDAVLAYARYRPDVILHCGGLALADVCERDPARARAVHVGGTRNVAELARACGARVVYPQSVFIFDGREIPVTESTVPAPAIVYGTVKLEAERHLLAETEGALSVRMAGFFGGDDKDKNFVGKFVRELDAAVRAGQASIDVGERIWQPTYTLDLARNTLLLVAHRCSGVYHMGALGEATFLEVARVCVEELRLDDRIAVRPSAPEMFEAAEPARRPFRMVTANERLEREGLLRQRRWDVALRDYLARPWFDRFRAPLAAAPRSARG